MKKLRNILITSVLVCAMLISCALPVFASSPNLPYEVYDWESYNRAIKRLDSGYDEYISMRVSSLQLMEQKEIHESNMTVNFGYSEYYVNDSAICSGGTHNRFFTIYGDNVTINFDEGVYISTIAKTEVNGACLRIIGNNCTIYNADIHHCSAESGGAIYVEGDNCVLDHCTFFECWSNEDGGAVYLNGSNCKVVDCSFYNCLADKNGGAIYTNDDAVIENCYFRNCGAGENGGAIYTNDTAVIESCKFLNCRAAEDGGAVYTNDDAVIENCNFSNCGAVKNGGSIYDNNSVGEVSIKKCSFEEGNCGENGTWVYGGGDAVVDYCTFSGGDTEHYYYDCEKVTNSVGSTEPQKFIRPLASQYAQNAMDNNEYCDVIRRDEHNPVESDKKYFTLTAKTSDVFGWRATDDSPLTITAKEGYIITAIEGHVPAYDYNGARDYEYLIADHGKKSIDDKYVNMYGEARGDIDAWIKIGDIYSDSVSLTTQKDIYNRHTMLFDEFIVYFAEDTPENRRSEITESSPEYTRDGETYDVFTFDKDKASYTEPYTATSKLKGFTLTDTLVPTRGHIYGWATKITITAPEGYTITRIEGRPVHFEGNVEFLKSNAGTIVNQGKPLAKDGIVRINDINASSVEIDCTTNYVEFGEFLVFYEKKATLGSVFSGGSLTVIVGVAAAAVAAAVVIVVVKKKKKPATADGAEADNPEKEDE